ncbi:hypothetical protein PUN28_009256 [Cardiocondyla obscurior]|uniref:Secreted protein n=1 Tax=Cardiocondyla obscurior TaxID=286306 RepID=A0AAW2FR66_9HYME
MTTILRLILFDSTPVRSDMSTLFFLSFFFSRIIGTRGTGFHLPKYTYARLIVISMNARVRSRVVFAPRNSNENVAHSSRTRRRCVSINDDKVGGVITRRENLRNSFHGT